MAPVVVAAGIGAIGGMASSTMGAYGQEKAADETAKRNMQMNAQNIASNEKINEANIGSSEKMFGQNLSNIQAQQAADKAAYEAALKRGDTEMTAGENAFISETGTPNTELAKQEADIKAGTAKQLQQGAGQMSANLAAQGVRGGAASTLMNRGTGEMATTAQTDINKMKYEDEAQRQADLRAYQAQKSRLGQTAGLAGVAK